MRWPLVSQNNATALLLIARRFTLDQQLNTAHQPVNLGLLTGDDVI